MHHVKNFVALFIAVAVLTAMPLQACEYWQLTCGEVGAHFCTSSVLATGTGTITSVQVRNIYTASGVTSSCWMVSPAELVTFEVTYVDCDGYTFTDSYDEAVC